MKDLNETMPILDKSLATLINKSVTEVESGVSFLQTQLPDVIHQLLMWKFVYSLSMFIFGIILLIGATYILFKYLGKGKKINPNDHREVENYTIILFIIGVAYIIIVSVAYTLINLTWLQIWIAPKVWLIEYTSQLIKG